MGFLPIRYLRDHWTDSFATFTNLSYFGFGLALIWIHHQWIPGIGLLLIGTGSTGYHWLRSRAWHKFDMLAIVYCFAAITGWLIGGVTGALFGTWAAGIVHGFYERINTRIVIGGLGAMALIAHGMQNPIEQTVYVFMVFIAAFVVSYVADTFYSRNHKIYDGLHGIWHVISSYGIYLLCLPPVKIAIEFATSQNFYT